MGLDLADKKTLESLMKFNLCDIDNLIIFTKQLLPSQGSQTDFLYGLMLGIIIGNFIEKFAKKYGRSPDEDEILDIYFTLSLKSPKIRKLILKNVRNFT
ncbi:MAG: hypothetical protein MRJ93_01975 [Nitrososphaeraceae archaeon]|nr:hypothetical protein [Nitrososphaeraceae archaeon]